MPQKLAQKFYIINFREKYGFTIGIVFVISTALLIVLLLSKIFHFFYDKYASKRLGTAQIKYLKNMTPEQMTIIREFLREPTHTLPLPMNNGLVIELQQQREDILQYGKQPTGSGIRPRRSGEIKRPTG